MLKLIDSELSRINVCTLKMQIEQRNEVSVTCALRYFAFHLTNRATPTYYLQARSSNKTFDKDTLPKF